MTGDQSEPVILPSGTATVYTSDQSMGNVPPTPASNPAAASPTHVVMARLKSEGRWFGQVENVRDQMMKDSKKRFPNINDRRQWVYGELDRMYPPSKEKPMVSEMLPIGNKSPSDDGSIQGLGTIPPGWPELPANASLSAEVGWVQANRLRCVTEQMGKATRVDLSKALSPAPSWAALGWLETSIRSYAKFVDVAARATSSDDGEQGVMKRERVSIDEAKALLREMEDSARGE
jgi:hypothetical protein